MIQSRDPKLARLIRVERLAYRRMVRLQTWTSVVRHFRRVQATNQVLYAI